MKSGWGWRRATRRGRSGWTARSLGALAVAVPWLMLLLLLVLLQILSGSLTASEGVLFDLPEPGLGEGEATGLVALVLTTQAGTLVFFDDARYTLADGVSAASLGDHLDERVRQSRQETLLLLADRSVPTGDLMALAKIARERGVRRVLFASKRAEERGE